MQRIPWVSSCYHCTAWSWIGSLEWQPSTKVHSKQSCCGVCLQNTEGMLSKASLHQRHRHWAGRPYYHRCLCFAQHRKKWPTPTCRLPAPSTIRPQPRELPQWGTTWHRVCEHFFFSQKPHESLQCTHSIRLSWKITFYKGVWTFSICRILKLSFCFNVRVFMFFLYV